MDRTGPSPSTSERSPPLRHLSSTSSKAPDHGNNKIPFDTDMHPGPSPAGGIAQGGGSGNSKPASKRKRHRNRKRRNRRQSFLGAGEPHSRPDLVEDPVIEEKRTVESRGTRTPSLYKLGRDLSSTSLESEALLDHRYDFMIDMSSTCVIQVAWLTFYVLQRSTLNAASKR